MISCAPARNWRASCSRIRKPHGATARLLSELEDLRGLNEHRDLEQAKRALEAQVEQKEILLKEVNHRVKNSLQIVSAILELQGASLPGTPAADALRSAASRVMAIARGA